MAISERGTENVISNVSGAQILETTSHLWEVVTSRLSVAVCKLLRIREAGIMRRGRKR